MAAKGAKKAGGTQDPTSWGGEKVEAVRLAREGRHRRTYSDLAAEMGVTRERVRQVYEKDARLRRGGAPLAAAFLARRQSGVPGMTWAAIQGLRGLGRG